MRILVLCTSSPRFDIFRLCNFSHTTGEVSQCSFNTYNDIEHFFMCLLAITVSSSLWSVFKLLPVLKMGVLVFSTEL